MVIRSNKDTMIMEALIVDIEYTHSGDNHDFPHKYIWLENLGRSKHK